MKYIKINNLEDEIPIFDTEELCIICSYPLDIGGCYGCNIFKKHKVNTGGKHHFDRIFAVGEYHAKPKKDDLKDNLSRLILCFKNDKKYIPYCTELLKMKILEVKDGLNLSEKNSIVCSVPDSEDKPYQKSALLASELAKEVKIPFQSLLRKIKTTKKQHKIHPIGEKFENVKGAFEINKDLSSNIKNKNILLVDDVVSSLASVNECSKILRENGAKGIFVFAIGRTTFPPKEIPKKEKQNGDI